MLFFDDHEWPGVRKCAIFVGDVANVVALSTDDVRYKNTRFPEATPIGGLGQLKRSGTS